jgi:hypothetical protein
VNWGNGKNYLEVLSSDLVSQRHIVEERYKSLAPAFQGLFHSGWYEKLVLGIILSNSAYLMTFNTSLRPGEFASASAESGSDLARAVERNSTGTRRSVLGNFSLASVRSPNITSLGGLGGLVLRARAISPDCWWHMFFVADLFGQVVSQGSLAGYLADGDRLADFFITVGTTIALIVDVSAAGGSDDDEFLKFLHSVAIFRLVRATKVSFLRPL